MLGFGLTLHQKKCNTDDKFWNPRGNGSKIYGCPWKCQGIVIFSNLRCFGDKICDFKLEWIFRWQTQRYWHLLDKESHSDAKIRGVLSSRLSGLAPSPSFPTMFIYLFSLVSGGGGITVRFGRHVLQLFT